MRSTHTLAQMEVPKSVYDLIKAKLLEAGYDHAVLDHRDDNMLSMQGIGLVAAPELYDPMDAKLKDKGPELVPIGQLFDQYEAEVADKTVPALPEDVYWDEQGSYFRTADGCILGGPETNTAMYEKWKPRIGEFPRYTGGNIESLRALKREKTA